jgi:hypothetical protein
MTVVLTPVTRSGYWRVEIAWPRSPLRYLGRFNTRAEAEKWIGEHHWLTTRREEASAGDPEATNDR